MPLLQKYFLQTESASQLGVPTAAGGALSRGTCHFLPVTMATQGTCDIHKGRAQDLCRCPDHNLHSSLQIIASTQLGFSIQELPSLPSHFGHLFKPPPSYGNHLVFTNNSIFTPRWSCFSGRRLQRDSGQGWTSGVCAGQWGGEVQMLSRLEMWRSRLKS